MGEKVVIGIYASNTERVRGGSPRLIASVHLDLDVDDLMRVRGWKKRVLEACQKHVATKKVMSVNAVRTGPDGCNVAITVTVSPDQVPMATRKSTVSLNGRPIVKTSAPTPAALRRQGRNRG